jgi:hypothetical protein
MQQYRYLRWVSPLTSLQDAVYIGNEGKVYDYMSEASEPFRNTF